MLTAKYSKSEKLPSGDYKVLYELVDRNGVLHTQWGKVSSAEFQLMEYLKEHPITKELENLIQEYAHSKYNDGYSDCLGNSRGF
jgi:uncharacterized protein with NRDE domain